MTIYDLKGLNKSGTKRPIFAMLPDDELVELEEEFDIEDGVLYLTLKENVETKLDSISLLQYLDHERQDDCWDGHKSDNLFEGTNTLYDCEVMIYNDITGDTFSLTSVGIESDKVILYTWGSTQSESDPIQLCNLEVDIQMLPDGTFDVYINNEGDSGCHYEHVTADKIGELVAEEVEIRAEGRI